jgi:hypothetical protein
MDDKYRHGRPGSWLAVSLIMGGFAVGGVALTLGPLWWLFWAGTGIAVVGGVVALVVDVFADVMVEEPRSVPQQPHPAAEHSASHEAGKSIEH